MTHIDERAWPDGTGRIRYGFDRARIAQYESEDEFRQAYLDAVNAYHGVRAQIDEQLDRFRAEEGLSPTDVVPPATVESWKAQLDPELNRQEAVYRKQMNEFTALHPLHVGDVVQVKPLTPHALQHGVRVIEFQTPHYERYVLSFAQKVLTHSGWDTQTAMAKATLSATMQPEPDPVSEEPGRHKVDIIADFEQFQVQRVALAPGASWPLSPSGTYLVIAAVEGVSCLNDAPLRPEQACYIPAASKPLTIANDRDTWSSVLLAMPKT